MKLDVKVLVPMAVLFVVTIVLLVAAIATSFAPAYWSFAIALVLLIILYATEVLGYRVGGHYVTLQKDVERLKQENDELRDVARALYKAVVLVYEGSGRLGGPGEPHIILLKKYVEPIHLYLESGIEDEVFKEISDLVAKFQEEDRDYGPVSWGERGRA